MQNMASVRSAEDRFRPSNKMLDKTAAAGFSYFSPRTQQQQRLQVPIARSLSTGMYNSLPRQKSSHNNNNEPTSMTQARRKLVNTALQDYLKSLNAMTRSIVLETETIEKENHGSWIKMDVAKKEDLVNDHFMPADVRMQYEYERSLSLGASHGAGHTFYTRGQLPARENTLQPSSSEWEDWHGDCHEDRQLSNSTKDLVYTNEWSSMVSDHEDLTLSQPSPHRDEVEIVEHNNFNRLHKTQLSFRPSHKQHAVKPRQAPHISHRSQLSSDGESPRTSDEDWEGGAKATESPLGFQRSKLRSYSVRSKKGSNNLRNSANLRSSVRTNNRIKNSQDEENTTSRGNSFAQNCRPSHYHTYSTTSNETDFDEEIDMPDNALLLDHIPSSSRKISTDNEADEETDKYPSSRPFKAPPRITLEAVDTTPSSLAGTISPTNLLSPSGVERDPSNIYRPPSRESLDMDSVSMAPSELSKYPMDDEESVIDPSRMTPDSTLSLSSYSRPRSKNSEIAVLRNGKGKRAGSYIKVSTSDFADRHTQFKSNMLQKHHLDDSGTNTRATSPASSVCSGIPLGGYAIRSKHDSVAESTTSDLPTSPDHLSTVSSPPSTPLAISYTSSGFPLRKNLSSANPEHRESGYISSSSESFPVTSRQ